MIKSYALYGTKWKLSFGNEFQHLKTLTAYSPTSTLYAMPRRIYEGQFICRTA
jgi:hypothetical protein